MDEWAVQVEGAGGALERLAVALPTGDEIREVSGATFLVRQSWQQLAKPEEVDALGRARVNQVNALLRVDGRALDVVRFGGVAKLKAGGGREFYDAATVEIRVTASAVDQHLGPDGKPVAPPPDPLGDWLAKLDGNTELQEALSVYATAADWFDLYKAYEAIKKALGGQKLVESVIGASMRSRLTQTANHHRHPDVSLPAKPVTYQEALQLVGRLFEAWLAKS